MTGIVVSAPHEGYDLYTGLIANHVHENLGTGLVVATDFRRETEGWWFNVNRPTEQRVTDGQAERKERITDHAKLVFDRYREHVRRARGEDSPCRLLVEVHMRDPHVPVVELVTTGFSKAQMYTIKKVLAAVSRNITGESLQHEVLGLLGDEKVYQRDDTGEMTRFYYSAYRTTSIGSLQQNITARGIHVELPPAVTHDPQRREAYAAALERVISWAAKLDFGD